MRRPFAKVHCQLDCQSSMNMTGVPLEPLLLDLPGYGYVLVTVVLVWLLLFWQGFMVGRMRTKYKVTSEQQIFSIVFQIFS